MGAFWRGLTQYSSQGESFPLREDQLEGIFKVTLFSGLVHTLKHETNKRLKYWLGQAKNHLL